MPFANRKVYSLNRFILNVFMSLIIIADIFGSCAYSACINAIMLKSFTEGKITPDTIMDEKVWWRAHLSVLHLVCRRIMVKPIKLLQKSRKKAPDYRFVAVIGSSFIMFTVPYFDKPMLSDPEIPRAYSISESSCWRVSLYCSTFLPMIGLQRIFPSLSTK